MCLFFSRIVSLYSVSILARRRRRPQKIFQGAGFQTIFKQVESRFGQTHSIKPVSTRGESVETFIVARKMKHPAAQRKLEERKDAAAKETQPSTPQKKKK